jgi:hypothetical protein
MTQHASSTADRAVILRTHRDGDLQRIAEPDVQAVIYEPESLPPWLWTLAAAVESGALVVPRSVLPCATLDEIAGWLAALPEDGLAPDVRDALFDDILGLAGRLGASTGAQQFMVRIFTAAPTTECGFHVDTVPRHAPPWGLLRVYNGEGTAFVEPDNVRSVAEFYKYLSRRERLERERRAARDEGDAATCGRLDAEIAALDRYPSFLERAAEIWVVPAGAVVAFKHIDVGLHWTPHAKAKAWIHCSPMAGAPRLVVNVTCPVPVRARTR